MWDYLTFSLIFLEITCRCLSKNSDKNLKSEGHGVHITEFAQFGADCRLVSNSLNASFVFKHVTLSSEKMKSCRQMWAPFSFAAAFWSVLAVKHSSIWHVWVVWDCFSSEGLKSYCPVLQVDTVTGICYGNWVMTILK